MKELLLAEAWGADFEERLAGIEHDQFQGRRGALALATFAKNLP